MIEPLGFLVGQLHDLPARSVNRSYIDVLRKNSTLLRGNGSSVVYAAAASSVLRFRQQIPLVLDLPLPFAGAFQTRQRIELSRGVVEPARVPQQRGQHQPGVHVAEVSPQQPFEDVLRLVIIAFQVMIQGLGETVFARIRLLGGRPAAGTAGPTNRPPPAKTRPKAAHKVLRSPGPISSLQPKLASNSRSSPAAMPRAKAKPGPASVDPELGKPRPQARCPRHPAHRSLRLGRLPAQPRNCNFQNQANQGNKRRHRKLGLPARHLFATLNGMLHQFTAAAERALRLRLRLVQSHRL